MYVFIYVCEFLTTVAFSAKH